ncbi:MAG TPA: STM4014 family protein [Kofleriaceae bacterium]
MLYPRQHHLGFTAVLDELAAALAAAPGLRVPQPPAAIQLLFDKSATSARWRAAGIPVPEPLPGGDVRDPDDLRARMDAAGWTSVYVKLSSGSSASCLAVVVRRPSGEHVMTTVEDTGAARYNTRRIQRLTDRARINRTLGFILGEGAQVERAIGKARLGHRYFDCRVLTIAGDPAFVVMRTATHPITNLNLGGLRGDLAALRAAVPADAWDAAMASCRAVQRTSGAFHVGVDLMFEPGLTRHRVLEGNAFGDLLPNLLRDGLDVYGWQIRQLRAG